MAGSPYFRAKHAVSEAPPTGTIESVRKMTRYRALVSRAVDVFGDEIKASRWLSMPNSDLSGQTPLQAVQSAGYDMRVLEPIFVRIEHGVDY